MKYYGTNRYVCDILSEMRKCQKTHNYSILLSLIEEVQIMVNRMEAGLGDRADLAQMSEDRSKLKKEIRDLESKLKDLKEKCPEDSTEDSQ